MKCFFLAMLFAIHEKTNLSNKYIHNTPAKLVYLRIKIIFYNYIFLDIITWYIGILISTLLYSLIKNISAFVAIFNISLSQCPIVISLYDLHTVSISPCPVLSLYMINSLFHFVSIFQFHNYIVFPMSIIVLTPTTILLFSILCFYILFNRSIQHHLILNSQTIQFHRLNVLDSV